MPGREEYFVVLNPKEGVFFDGDELFARFFGGEGFGGGRLAEVADGADEAAWGAGGAKGLAELHEGGVEEPGVLVVEKRSGGFPDDFTAIGRIYGSV